MVNFLGLRGHFGTWFCKKNMRSNTIITSNKHIYKHHVSYYMVKRVTSQNTIQKIAKELIPHISSSISKINSIGLHQSYAPSSKTKRGHLAKATNQYTTNHPAGWQYFLRSPSQYGSISLQPGWIQWGVPTERTVGGFFTNPSEKICASKNWIISPK